MLIILAVVLLIFGGSKLPKLARSLGEAQTEFKKATADEPVVTTPAAVAERRTDG